MKNPFIGLSLAVVLVCPYVSSQWVQTNGPYGGAINSLAVSGTNLFAGADSGGVFLSTDFGDSWAPVNQGLTCTWVNALAVVGSVLLAGTQGGGVFVSANCGENWSPMTSGLTDSNVTCLAANSTAFFAGTSVGLFRSTDDGSNWNVQGLKDTSVVGVLANGTTVLGGWEWGWSPYTWRGGIHRSDNNGDTWTAVNAGIWLPRVTVIAASTTFVFAGARATGICPACIFRSSDDGISWTEVYNSDFGGKENYEIVTGLAVAGCAVFAATDRSLYRSTDNGDTWSPANEGLRDSSVVAIVVFPPYLFIAVDSSVWRRPLSELLTSVDSEMSGLPHELVLHQNYPNPFNPSTTIRYELPKSVEVRLSVYDMLGREVSVLVNERRDAGSYEVQFDAAGLSSGVYIYRIQAGDFVQAKKFVILK